MRFTKASQVTLQLSYVKLKKAQLRYKCVKEESCFGGRWVSWQVHCGLSQAGKNCGSVAVFAVSCSDHADESVQPLRPFSLELAAG